MNQDDNAIRYCLSIGADPYEMVKGPGSWPERVMAPRWQWYVGARAGQ